MKSAASDDVELAIIDGSPGIGCPLSLPQWCRPCLNRCRTFCFGNQRYGACH